MPVKKQASKNSSTQEPGLFEKIGEQASHLKDELIAGKDHLVELAGEKIAAVKSSIKKYRAEKKVAAKKAAKKTVKPVKKAAAKIAKKAAVVKKKIIAKKTVIKKKAAAKKASPKKKAPLKKAAKAFIRRKR